MRKSFTYPEKREFYKKLSIKRGKHNQERKKHKYNKRHHNQAVQQKLIEAPKNFSFVENPDESMKFLHDFEEIIKTSEIDVMQDFSSINNVTPDALLYMMLYIENIDDSKINNINIGGILPKNRECKKLFQKSGFIEHINSRKLNLKDTDKDILTIRVGNKTESKTAQEVVKHVRKWLKIERKDTKSIQTILIESMTNTHNHAYKHDKEGKWYLMAYHYGDEVHFVFLDNGYGIPSTLETKLIDYIFGTKYSDNKLIMSALRGEKLRTQTGELKRGKGLPKIYSHSKEDNIKELIIIANKAFVNCKEDITKNIKNSLNGTLISWKIIKGNINNEKDNN